jgi:hypothetical protein
MVYVWHVII